MTIYSWPISLLKDTEKAIRNFIWSGDISKRKLVTVSWKNVCKPLNEGGLCLRSLIFFNEEANMKILWDMLHSDQPWASNQNFKLLKTTPFR